MLQSEVSKRSELDTIWQKQPNPLAYMYAKGMVGNRVNSTDPVVQAC